MKFIKYIAGFLLLLLLAGGLTYAFLPWKPVVGKWLAGRLQAQGLPVSELSIGDVTLTHTDFSDVKITLDPPLTLPTVRVNYTPENLLGGQLETIEIRDINHTFTPASGKTDKSPPGLTLPAPDTFTSVPLERIIVRDSHIGIKMAGGSFSAPIKGEIQFGSKPKANLTLPQGSLKPGQQNYRLDSLLLTAAGSGEHWDLSAELKEIYLQKQGEEEKQPLWLPLSLSASGKASPDRLTSNLKATHKDFTFTGELFYNGASATLSDARLKVAKGTVSAKRIALLSDPVTATLQFQAISLEELLQLLLQDRRTVQATGRVEGKVSVRFSDGRLVLEEGQLHNISEGVLSLSERHLSALPQQVAHVKQVSELLKHFEYHDLAITASETDGNVQARLALKGKNPEAYEGSEVHLNINLRGDVLESIQSALGLYDLPQQYLKEVQDAK